MKNIISLFQIIMIFIIFMACEKNTDLEVPEYKQKLVIHSFISPDDTILNVHVGSTTNIYGNPKDKMLGLPAVVTLIDGENEIIFNSPQVPGGNYSKKYRIEADKDYKIKVKCAGYPDVSATCHVPALNVFNISVDTITDIYFDEGYGNYMMQKFLVKFSETPNKINYYNIYATSTLVNSYGINKSALYFLDSNNESYNRSSKIISDHLIDGSVISTDFYANWLTRPDASELSYELNAVVLETDADYFKYHTSLSKYSGSDAFTEFSPVYSNIEGGYGIFASYVKYQKTLKLK